MRPLMLCPLLALLSQLPGAPHAQAVKTWRVGLHARLPTSSSSRWPGQLTSIAMLVALYMLSAQKTRLLCAVNRTCSFNPGARWNV
jgi:hypothetical protein